ncbi:rhodanese-like domain-containing protein [Candidatus Izemoplasma sp. B36]|uniref:rhodanese-like domain-containing protein n=1 Tax=Candidatus Izemoplasma sp. B36 TaxID=3242468 RepID=UPI0035585584
MFLVGLGDMSATTWIVVIGAGLVLGLLISRRNPNNKDQIVDLKAEDFRANMRKGQLIDIRREDAYKSERINGSRNFPKRSLLQNLFKLRADQAIFLVADNDRGQVKSIARKLIKKGYHPVYVLVGGIKEWPYQLKK